MTLEEFLKLTGLRIRRRAPSTHPPGWSLDIPDEVADCPVVIVDEFSLCVAADWLEERGLDVDHLRYAASRIDW